MRTPGILSIAILFALPVAAYAQAPSPFDGTYRFVASSRVTANYVAKGGQSAPCPDRRAGTLTVAQGRANFTTETGIPVSGSVGPQGVLVMGAEEPGSSRPIDLKVNGSINAAGTARAREAGFGCSWDFVWQR